jgi:hypothetical protein
MMLMTPVNVLTACCRAAHCWYLYCQQAADVSYPDNGWCEACPVAWQVLGQLSDKQLVLVNLQASQAVGPRYCNMGWGQQVGGIDSCRTYVRKAGAQVLQLWVEASRLV